MSPPGLQSPRDTPRPGPAGTAPGPAQLAGITGGGEEETPTPGAPGEGPGNAATEQLGEAVQRLRESEATVLQIMRPFPPAVPALRTAKEHLSRAGEAIRGALKQVITSPGQPEPPGPSIGG